MDDFFSRDITLLTGSDKAQLLKHELNIHTYEDLLRHYPFRYEDRNNLSTIAALTPATPGVQLNGYIKSLQKVDKGKKRLVALFEDHTGQLELIWFHNFSWIIKKIKPNVQYRIWGKPVFSPQGQKQLIHPEICFLFGNQVEKTQLLPIYHSTERLKRNQLDAKGIVCLQRKLLSQLGATVEETLPQYLLTRYKLLSLKEAFKNIHFPGNQTLLKQAQRRLKFEELFYVQLKLLKARQVRVEKQNGKIFNNVSLLNLFYHNYLPFHLTNGQKETIKAIYRDLSSGKQMNRLLQGDVGSGKTIVAFLSMLVVIASKAQVAIMAPTEVLAKQHFERFHLFAGQLNLNIALLTGSTKKKEREHILYRLKVGILHIIVGTHALLSDDVSFNELGFFVIDEQHRFGVAQRAGLLTKNPVYAPHMLIMTATPIPRTLAMTFYGDLDISTIYELPSGRQSIQTQHYYENARLKVFHFISGQLLLGRQIYIVYPLIEASAALDYNDLMAGYTSVCRAFPDIPIGIMHGKMDSASKDIEMKRFEKNETRILVTTTVIEVGVNVPNATVMVIESAERFGLSQLHQLRGRVGRGNAQSYCILMTDYRLSKVGKERIETMVKTNNGFEIAELDLRLRGPGDLMGLQQSGVLNLKIADLSKDGAILEAACRLAKDIIQQDPEFQHPDNLPIYKEYTRLLAVAGGWNRIG
ncbi:MAG: ATP-dependent DNA helicase RecG [Candidatus Cardinium sp.]|uniref:ATP-dependent DNA helicase RecG n=1 Tax=Cardinium endosymbiont of Dermatophagoides farinae TaxID=2597823 RepID=UPI0011833DCA|nr:ATP-dependent DNA helicase RecG [Cardinium endosymbiont of Dermatophagoides farinae]TSJ81396.1 ATP-dependent DNA helicase RecG [Cardinium endosymbiont of Dermatophagoides farinae]UWW97460.1 MAG: ATP-dependent DNA helicase RecG [Candidatus Cardinium sp.]